jgi:hypothetical protein
VHRNLAYLATRVLALLALTVVTLVPGLALAGSSGAPTTSSTAQYNHIFVIVEENTEFHTIIGNPLAPTLNQLANANGLATNYFGAIHPSEGNYVALVGGDAYGIQDDASYKFHTIYQPSLVDQLEGAGLTWKGYFQNMPSVGFLGTCYPLNYCLYASKHNGFLNFAHVQFSATEQANLVPDTNLTADLATGNVANFVFIVPDQCHDYHGVTGACAGQTLEAQTDAYLKSTTDAIMSSSVWQQGTNAIVVVFDEGGTNLGCCDANPGGGRVVAIVARNNQPGPLQDATPYNHYSLVASIQTAFGLGCQFNGTPIGFTCDTSQVKPMSLLFGL